MSTFNIKSAPRKRAAYINAWQEFAADESFAGMTLEEFEAATSDTVTVREEIEQCLVKVAGLRRRRGELDRQLRNQLKLVVNAVRGNPAYGEDSPLYKALGYVPRSERASGLHRGTGDAEATAAPEVSADKPTDGESANPDAA